MPDLTYESLRGRVSASVLRVVDVANFDLLIQDELFVLPGVVRSKEEAELCAVVARLIPGIGKVKNRITVQG